MWGLHLKQRGKWWHYYRAVPSRFRDVDARSQICFALKTTDFFEAKLRAAHRYAAAADAQLRHGLKPQHAQALSNEDLLHRLQLLLETAPPVAEQKSVLGLAEKPKLSMMDAYDRFWDHIEDEWSNLSHDQRRVKRNGYHKALSNFREAVGDVAMYDVKRHHALSFRSWWLKHLKERGLKPHTGNKEFNALRLLITTNFDIDAIEMTNPFARIRLKDEVQVSRLPFEREQIVMTVKPGALGKLAPEFVRLYRLLVNTGMRPVEAIGLELSDVILDHDIPHVHVRKNATRG